MMRLTVLAMTAAVAASGAEISAHISRVRLEKASREGLEFRADLYVKAAEALTLRGVRFRDARVGSTPVTVDAITERLEFKAGEARTIPARVVVTYQDIAQATELGRLVSGKTIPVQSVIVADVELGWRAALARGSRIVAVEANFSDSVALTRDLRLGSATPGN